MREILVKIIAIVFLISVLHVLVYADNNADTQASENKVEPILVEIVVGKTEIEAGEPVAATYIISGGNGNYKSISYSCMQLVDGNGSWHGISYKSTRKDENGVTSGTISCVPNIGGPIKFEISAEDTDRHYTKKISDQVVVHDNRDFSALTGNKILSFEAGHYIDTHGATADVTAKKASTTGLMVAVDACSPGDIYYVNGIGGTLGRLWAFVAADGTVIDKAASRAAESMLKLTTPEDAAYLVCNFYANGGYAVKDTYLRDDMKRMNAAIVDELNPDGFDISFTVTTKRPLGFQPGLYHTADGMADGTLNYIRAAKAIPISVGTKWIEVTPGTDTTVNVVAFSAVPDGVNGADNSAIYLWGERSNKIVFTPVDGVFYYVGQKTPYTDLTEDILPKVRGFSQIAEKIEPLSESIWEIQEGHVQTVDRDWHVFGSSSEAGYYSYFDEDGNPQTVRNRPDLMYTYIANQKYFHRNYINHAEGGAGFIAKGVQKYKLNALEMLDTVESFRPRSLITVHYSGNDYNLGLRKKDTSTYRLGSLESELADGSFYGNAMAFFERLIEKAPDSTIIMVIKYFKCNTGDAEHHYSYGTKKGDCTWGDLAEALIEICNHYGIPYIDWSRGTEFINVKNAPQVMPDGKHITKELHETLAQLFIGSMMYY